MGSLGAPPAVAEDAAAAGEASPATPEGAAAAGSAKAPPGVVPGEVTAPETSFELEVVAFRLQGKQPYQILRIEDLDAATTPRKQRFLPLLRLLTALKIEYTQTPDGVRFSPGGIPPVTLDLKGGRIEISKEWRPVTALRAVSIITGAEDVYLPPDVVGSVLTMQIEWSEPDYQFSATSQRLYPVWREPDRPSLLGLVTKEVPINLPRKFGPAFPPDWSLDFFEFRLRTATEFHNTDTQPAGTRVDNLEQSFWGSAAGGQFYLNLAEPSFQYDRDGFDRRDEDVLQLRWGEWVHRTPDREIALGDSNFSLGELLIPFSRFTGVRVNGLTGMTLAESVLDRSGRGYRATFHRPEIFQGFARVGSTAELFVNGRLVETDEVIEDYPGAAPGEGLWRFREVTLPPGSTNEIRIVITEPSGQRFQIQRTILARSILLPEGRSAYLLGAGTNRDPRDWTDTRGALGGGRLLHGVTDTLTVGGEMGFQESFYRPLTLDATNPRARQIPDRSVHAGVDAAWQPDDWLMFSGSAAVGLSLQPEDDHDDDNAAVRVRADITPHRSLNVHAEGFRYGTDFFNGAGVNPRDRQGAAVTGRWRPHAAWRIGGAAGWVEDNLDGGLDRTTSVDFQTFEIQTTSLPRSTLGFEVDRLGSRNESRDERVLWTGTLTASLWRGATLDAAAAEGDPLVPETDTEFFTGLNVPGIPLFQTPYRNVLLRQSLLPGQSVAGSYKWTREQERYSLIHTFTRQKTPRFRLFNEIGYDDTAHEPFADNRLEYFITKSGSTRLGLQAQLQQKVWSVQMVLTVTELWSFLDRKAHRISDRGISPYTGAIHGYVFDDIDADGFRAPGEAGMEEVRVSNSFASTVTDASGYFILPSDTRVANDTVFLDIASVPATHTFTNGVRDAYVFPNTITRVNLGLCPAHFVVGYAYVFAPDLTEKPLRGVRILILNTETGARVADSVTAADGSFYLGNLLPGRYTLKIDTATVPSQYMFPFDEQDITIQVSGEIQERYPPFFVARQRPTLETK